MIRIASTLIVGLIFGIGLAVSGMMNPAKVLGFLDFAGSWDPTLGLVMTGVLIAAIPGYALARRRPAPLAEPVFKIPTRRDIDTLLVVGALLFGIGWDLAGFCPGPAVAVAVAGTGLLEVYVFFVAMIGSMVFFSLFSKLRNGRS